MSSIQDPSTSTQKKKKEKTKSSTKSTKFIDAQLDEEDTDEEILISRNYEPINSTLSEADWDVLSNDPNVELWAIRIPHSLQLKHLDDLEVSLPTASSSKPTKFTKKHTSYHIDSFVPSSSPESQSSAAAAEMRSLTCLLPRQANNGQLYKAPIPVSRNIIISEAPSLPAEPTTSIDTSKPQPSTGKALFTVSTNHPPSKGFPHGHSKRPYQPLELLTGSFVPIGGGSSTDPETTETVDVDMDMEVPAVALTQSSSPKKEKKEKSKKKKDAVEDNTVVEDVIDVIDVDAGASPERPKKEKKRKDKSGVDGEEKKKKHKKPKVD